MPSTSDDVSTFVVTEFVTATLVDSQNSTVDDGDSGNMATEVVWTTLFVVNTFTAGAGGNEEPLTTSAVAPPVSVSFSTSSAKPTVTGNASGATTGQTSSTAYPTSITPLHPTESDNPGNPQGLSREAETGIGAGLGVAVILLIALSVAFILYRRRHVTTAVATNMPPSSQLDHGPNDPQAPWDPEALGRTYPAELYGSQGTHQTGKDGSVVPITFEATGSMQEQFRHHSPRHHAMHIPNSVENGASQPYPLMGNGNGFGELHGNSRPLLAELGTKD
ncbi:uncharacterized protein B0I36DRAFT_350601 [Microdochium trichocladiopsis]|uniref:Uncharacterized protein n=1 Tax=Microdochium trichocladiopsis TaxID=1682393 RepID=A0A9P8Y7G4_9PEZI|nr:uncharacterized protein B0I36DRAFT_350601 [Microdochium trichocladiopsis]KAH7029788.1 hypothetical protein B0I36DRAFT_350601 [Microdochium trichocladiopsis]